MNSSARIALGLREKTINNNAISDLLLVTSYYTLLYWTSEMVWGRWNALVRFSANNRFPRLSAHKTPGNKVNVMATTSQHGEEPKEKSGLLVFMNNHDFFYFC